MIWARQMGCGAHLAEIMRTAVGEFTLDQAVRLDDFERAAQAGDWRARIPLARLLPEFPRVTVLPVVERRVRHGSKFNVPIAQIQPGRVERRAGRHQPSSIRANGSRRGCASSTSRSG